MTCLTEYAKSAGYTGDYVLIKADQFNSGFAKPDFSETTIVFPRKGKVETVKFKDVAASLMGIGSISKEFFYLFYERSKDEKQKMDIYEIRKTDSEFSRMNSEVLAPHQNSHLGVWSE